MKTNMLRRAMVLLTPMVLLACTTATDPSRLLTVSGVVTQDGVPVPVTIEVTAGSFSISRDFEDGTYALTLGGGSVPASVCPSARVEATVYAPGGATIVEQEARDLGDCGEYTVDFEFP